MFNQRIEALDSSPYWYSWDFVTGELGSSHQDCLEKWTEGHNYYQAALSEVAKLGGTDSEQARLRIQEEGDLLEIMAEERFGYDKKKRGKDLAERAAHVPQPGNHIHCCTNASSGRWQCGFDLHRAGGSRNRFGAQ
jgi:hypothetical protein